MSELGRTLATAVDSQMQALIAEALAKHKTEINDGLDSLTDRLAQLRTSLDGIQDNVRAKEEGIRAKLDGLSEKVDKSKDTIDEKLAKIEEDLNKKANRYIIPMALVVLTGLVLGAFAILAA